MVNLTSLQKEVYEKYKKYEAKPPPKENKCSIKGPVMLTNTQKFVSKYMIDNISSKDGLFLYHTVGSGKTLTGVNLMKHFQEKGYSLIWITRTTLRKDLQKALDIIPLKKPPMVLSYKQFSNACKGRGDIYKKLAANSAKKGGKEFLYKTLVIIDEAHKLYTKDLKPQEMHDIMSIEKAIFNSYKVSSPSCKIVLMSATPITKEPKEIIHLINLLKCDPKDRLSLSIKDHLSKTAPVEFNREFIEKIQGVFSHVNTACDISKFAQSSISTIPVEISNPEKKTKGDCTALYKDCINFGIIRNKYYCQDRKNECLDNLSKTDYKIGQKKMLKEKCGLDLD
jgi:hypothetical protein